MGHSEGTPKARTEGVSTLLDFNHPDLVWKRPPVEVGRDHRGIVFKAGDRYLRVYARRDNNSHIFNVSGGGPVWKCSHPIAKGIPTLRFKSGRVCDYYPGVEHTVPLPGQHCYNCGRLRAEWIGKPESLGVYDTIQGPRWVPDWERYEWIARGMIYKPFQSI